MCIVIDTNCLSRVFNSRDSEHKKFKPVRDWILNDKGKVVFGGSTYISEFASGGRFNRLFNELKRIGKVVQLENSIVDSEEKSLKRKIGNPRFDDAHIMAIIAVSRCRVLCSIDKRSYQTIKASSLYPKGVKAPIIYSGGKKHKRHLIDKNIVAICQPCPKLSKEDRNGIESYFE